MHISELFARKAGPVFSFEFFPPQTDEGRDGLLRTIQDLAALEPGFVSVTYGAGGSTRDRTIELVSHIKGRIGLEAMAHLTCVGSSRQELTAVLDRLEAAGIENVIALRGDPPRGQTQFVVHPEGLANGSDLVLMIRAQKRPFCIAAAGYPETHLEAVSPEADLGYLALKVRSGAEVIITQLFFDNACYFDFLSRARALGVTVPIVPGIMPITNVAQIERFTKLCGASIPESLRQKLEPIREDAEAVGAVGVEHATEQCRGLLAGGAPGIHFYTLNRSRSTRDILSNLKRGAATRS
jgi:methylenetetrahydrofolate reductase (NADPH)